MFIASRVRLFLSCYTSTLMFSVGLFAAQQSLTTDLIATEYQELPEAKLSADLKEFVREFERQCSKLSVQEKKSLSELVADKETWKLFITSLTAEILEYKILHLLLSWNEVAQGLLSAGILSYEARRNSVYWHELLAHEPTSIYWSFVVAFSYVLCEHLCLNKEVREGKSAEIIRNFITFAATLALNMRDIRKMGEAKKNAALANLCKLKLLLNKY